ncbi:MAG TPA: alpha/beta fold hydrolase [Burkholderiales bacterium]|nr:alpha/beta fold hydrolase [Burkholderiales bacterium]
MAAALAGCVGIRDVPAPLPDAIGEQQTDSPPSGTIWTRPNRYNTDLILLVHGWNGDRLRTWSPLLLLLHSDETLAQYDIASFGYATGCGASYPGIDEVSEQLDAFVQDQLKRYDRVHIVAYSLGGLVARRFVVDVLKKRGRGALNVEHLLLVAVPNEGAHEVLTSVGSVVCGKQVAQAERGSTFLSELHLDWLKHVYNGGRRDIPATQRKSVPTLAVVGINDQVVERRSAASYLINLEVKDGHADLRHINSLLDPTYKILNNYIREKSLSETSVSDWQPTEDQKLFLRNWRESVRLVDGAVLKSHAARTRSTYVFVDSEVYVFTRKSGYRLPSRGAPQQSLKLGASFERLFVYDSRYSRFVEPREYKARQPNELPFYEVTIGDQFDFLVAGRAYKGNPFCGPRHPEFGIITSVNNTEIVEAHELALYSASPPTDVRAYQLDDEYRPWFVRAGRDDEEFAQLRELLRSVAEAQPSLAEKIDVSRLKYGRVFSLPMRDTRDTYLVKFTCDILPGK